MNTFAIKCIPYFLYFYLTLYHISDNIIIFNKKIKRACACRRSVIIHRLTSDQHDDYCKDFLSVGIGRYVPEAYGRETAEGEIKGRDITTLEKITALHVLDKRVSIRECDLKRAYSKRTRADGLLLCSARRCYCENKTDAYRWLKCRANQPCSSGSVSRRFLWRTFKKHEIPG